jgi:hypothetical protein
VSVTALASAASRPFPHLDVYLCAMGTYRSTVHWLSPREIAMTVRQQRGSDSRRSLHVWFYLL